MPRRIATQVSQLISRQVRGGYLKRPPVAFQTLVDHPHTPLPPRAPVERSAFDLPKKTSSQEWATYPDSNPNADADTSQSKLSRSARRGKTPKLGPQPIFYLEDRVRERFFNDHPWETLNPRSLVEGRTIDVNRRLPHPDATDLTAWGRNPSPEDAIACVVHLHRRHGLSLSQAYHNTLSSYHGLRAEHDHAARTAVFEARNYGAVFGRKHDGQASSATELERGFEKEGEELRKGAKFYVKTFEGSSSTYDYAQAAAAMGGLNSEAEEQARRKYRFRVRNTWAPMSQGEKYLEAALAARDRVGQEQVRSSSSSLHSSTASMPRAPVKDAKDLVGLLSATSDAVSSNSA